MKIKSTCCTCGAVYVENCAAEVCRCGCVDFDFEIYSDDDKEKSKNEQRSI